VYCMFVPTMAFFAKVSDPAIGGTYMTLLNTVCNLGMEISWLVLSRIVVGQMFLFESYISCFFKTLINLPVFALHTHTHTHTHSRSMALCPGLPKLAA